MSACSSHCNIKNIAVKILKMTLKEDDIEDMNNFAAFFNPIYGSFTILALITNGISFSYFSRTQGKTLGDKFLAYLNVVDAFACTSAAIGTFVLPLIISAMTKESLQREIGVGIAAVIVAFVLSAVFISGLTTAYLCALRTLSVVLPFLRPNKKLVYGSFGCFVSFFIAQEASKAVIVTYPELLLRLNDSEDIPSYLIGYNDIFDVMKFVETAALILIVTVCCAVSIRKLSTPNQDIGEENISESKKKAAVTILILSALFVVINSLWLVIGLYYYFHAPTDNLMTRSYNALPTINSAGNPIVYMVRMAGFRAYTSRILCRVAHRRRAVDVQAEETEL